ncbi:MAG TPA: diaminobutyrate acetyltransferase [Cellvibrionaceae bacterium]
MSGKDNIRFRHPTAADGFTVNQLVAANPPLDPNSVYCNLLQCSHFAGTAMAAFRGDEMIGFVSGYRPPETPHVLFVWQLVVDASARGMGLAKRLVKAQLAAEGCRGVTHIQTTITPDNAASWGVFKSLAKELDATLDSHVYFERDSHFGGQHEDEHLLVIGPF